MRIRIASLCLVMGLAVFAASWSLSGARAENGIRLAQFDTGAGTPVQPDINPANRKKAYIPIQTHPSDMQLIAVGTVKEVVKSTMFKLEDGKVFSLINVRIPIIFDSQALAYLRKTYVGQKVGVYQHDFPGVGLTDKQGNLAGHIVTEDNRWVQGDLVLQGLAWADSTPKNRDLVVKLYQFEELARTNKSGFWSTSNFAIRNAKKLDDQISSFQVVEDVVKAVRMKGNDVYFGFGDNPSTDFTILMTQNISGSFRRPSGHALLTGDWQGQRVRVRGWVESLSGPMIRVTHPEQVEFIGLDPQLNRPKPK